MGVDVCLYYESADGKYPDLIWLPEAWNICEAGEDDHPATHEINADLSRYYGPGYERGPWPMICGVIMSLMASSNVKRVWYFGDHSYMDQCANDHLTIEKVNEISAHYMANGDRPYRDYFKSARLAGPL